MALEPPSADTCCISIMLHLMFYRVVLRNILFLIIKSYSERYTFAKVLFSTSRQNTLNIFAGV